MEIPRETADVWSRWFRALGDPSRILILNLLATAGRPLHVQEIVDRLDVGQSTVSHHLRILADTGFVLADRRGTRTLYRVNDRCLECFPSAAEVVMGLLPRYSARRERVPAPWIDEEAS
ncbi:MAG TPA: metalloregulator ArsR/SmtB family transcription factor [Actinomycetota bacterium]|nr:metalloregulator ArsR/SmtB family transcription factor [Actinomycetota bacterium]